MCDVLPAIHALTRGDMTSKSGTKATGIKANPTAYLGNFGKTTDDMEDLFSNTEEHLVQVLNRGNHGIKTLDHLRYTLYHQRTGTTIQDLPPTSTATWSHILRAFYVTYTQVNCLQNVDLYPLEYGFELQDGSIVPTKNYQPLPDSMAVKCDCKKCATRICPCRELKLPCCIFCKCQASDTQSCKNPNGVIRGMYFAEDS